MSKKLIILLVDNYAIYKIDLIHRLIDGPRIIKLY